METEHESETEELIPSGPGEQLRAAREAKGMELAQIAAETRIPIRHLESIEAGRFDAMPSRTYAVGFSRTYAGVVGLDGHEIADQVRAELGDADYHRTAMGGGMEPGDPAKLPSTGLVWFGAIAAIILAIGAIAFFSTYFGSGTGPASLLAGSEETEESANTEDGEGEGEATASAPSASGQVVFTALDDGIWVRFYEEGGDRLMETVMEEGETYDVPKSASDPRINTALPNLLAITIDGQSVPKLAEEQRVMGDAPVSAEALLSRADSAESSETAAN